MPDIFAPIRETVAIRVPERHKVPIAIVGAGEIADLAHLPRTRRMVSVVRDSTISIGLRRRRWRSDMACQSLDSVDEIARPGRGGGGHRGLPVGPVRDRRTAARCGQALLCQKPISYDFDEAVRLVKHAEKRKRLMAEPAAALLGESRGRAPW
jgi:hypothetical protein